ncbi:hypothetical protein P3T36_006483 [Kitasatospora sp. MAP12-15]|uniref:hypothetical protein n=1 Tax=unclassified Kitasatospora TaxID=2633591 RepID=UPI0024758BF5|nr:hypothetical protein [Kitasatospora sp. MAP12-44]MDH6114973.1 hypothetical protein [Kitasatospora sp. MAP12-44]
MRHLLRLPTLALALILLTGAAALLAPAAPAAAAAAAARPRPGPIANHCATFVSHQLDARLHSAVLGKACTGVTRVGG